MKKFTRDFLLGELGIWRHLRKIGLGLVLALWTTLAFAQNPVTYQLKAADYTDCYRTDNSYVVPVMMQDFLKIKKFVLKLDYSATSDFVYAGFTLPEESLIPTMSTSHDAVNHVITFTWESASALTLPETVGKMATLFNVKFTIPTFQHQYKLTTKSLFTTDLKWTGVELWNDAGKCDILTTAINGGGLDVTQKWMNVVVDAGTANCYGSSVVATVTSPAHLTGMEYSFNGSDENPTNKTDVLAPSIGNTLVINDANCVSYIYEFDVDAIDPLTFTSADIVYTNCPGGLGDLEIIATKGTSPYKYYIIPEEQWSAGDNMEAKLHDVAPNWETLLAKYEKANYVQQVAAGTPENPRVYYVAVQDVNKCASLTGTTLNSWWKKVEVIDNNEPFEYVVDPLTDLMTECYGSTDGRIKFTINGGTPYADDEYDVALNGVYLGRMAAYDSNVMLPCGDGECEHTTLGAGTYEFVITDANGCSFPSPKWTVKQPDPVVFTVDHTDAGCGQAVGTLWIDEVISGGSDGDSPWQWWYTTDPEWKTNVSAPLAIDATATNLPAGYYYVKIADGNGCEFEYVNASGDKAIKILTTEFEVKPVSPILCYGGSTSVEIMLISGDAGHTFEYSKDGDNWQASNKFTGITAGTYTFYVKDLYPEPDCVVPFTVTIDQPKPLKMWVLDGKVKLPTCPGALDGNVLVQVMGGTPFEGGLYKFSVNDGRPSTVTTSTNNFAFGAGTYTITVEDKNGCDAEVTVEIKDWDNQIDFAEEIPVACAGDEVNLFNANPWNDNIWWDKIGLDWGFLEDFQWFPYVNHAFDDEMVDWALRWTSGDGWEFAPIQGNMMSRNPKLYISKEYSAAADIVKYGEIVGHESKFGAGTWYIVAKDEIGCYSNVDKIVITEPEKLVVNYMKEDAECFGSATGKVQLVAKNGRFFIPETWGVMYQYTMINTPNEDMPELYGGDKWDQVTWFNFNDLTKKDTQTIDLQAGYWWFAVRDYCGIFDQSQIRVLGPIKIEGYDPISAKAAVTEHVKCFNGTNGVIAVTDGKGGKPGALTYTLKMGSKTYTNTNTAGGYTFGGLTAGTWTLTVSDAYGCPVYTKSLVVEQPKELVLTLEAVHASCTGAKDGILRYKIAGGTPPYEISTNNDGVSWFPIGSVNVFDSRVGAGTYDVMLRDKNGCTTATKTITVSEPAPIAVTLTPTGVNCAQAERCDGSVNVVNNGTVKVAFSGGWGLANDEFVYVVKLFNSAGVEVVGSPNSTKDVAGDVTFTNLVAGTYKATVAEFNASLFPTPIITDPFYAEKGTAYVLPASGKQNPDLYCFTEKSTTVTAPALIAYNVTPTDVVCANTATGKIDVTNISGGVKPYTVTIEGPVATSQLLGATATSYKFENLPYGHYNVFVTDKNNCQVCLMAVTINNHDPLTLQMKLIKNATCNGATDGQIQVVPTGGVAPYTYAVVLASTLEDGYFPLEELDATGKLVWKTTDTFNVGAGIWVGFVKDAVGCIQGGATLPNGTPIMNHRVNVLEPSKVNASVFVPGVVADITTANGMVSCFGEADGFIKVTGLSGGSGSGWSAKVGGFGDPKWYSNVTVGSKLDGLTGTTLVKDPKNVTKAEKYWVIVYDSHQCASDTLWVPVYQPALFEIKAVVGEDAFICPGDLAGIVQIQKVAGGFGAIQYKYEAYEGTSTTPKYVSQWGAVNTFTGQAGYTYKVYAKDANGCDAEDVIFIAEPVQMQVNIENITCFSEPLKPASARITITGEEGRTYQVRYQKYPETTWSTWTSPFATTLDLVEKFTYGDGSEKEGHFTFEIKDNRGCVSTVKETFVPVQQPLKITICCPVIGECKSTIDASVSGGTTPYVVSVNDSILANFLAAGSKLEFEAGSYVMKVVDAHGCTTTQSFVIETLPVVKEQLDHAYKGELAISKNTEAGLDTMLAVGVHTFKYDFNGCERTLIVTVVDDLVRTATITALQSDATLMGKYREITGTVTAVVPGAGYFVQDANAAWSGIYVADATLTVVEGVGVKVEGTLSEVDNVTTLTAAKSVMVSAPLAITPLVMTDPAAAKNEMYESVLVIVKGARFMGAPAADGSWEIKTTDALKLTVNDWLFPYVPVNGHFYNVTGVVNGKTDLYKLEPRKVADVVDLSTTTPVIDVNNLQFKVYPNPFSDVLNIDNSEKLTRVTVTNIAGQRVIDVQYPERVIRTSNLVSGVYVVTLFTEEGIAKSERLVKR